jgi:hypothetical protein
MDYELQNKKIELKYMDASDGVLKQQDALGRTSNLLDELLGTIRILESRVAERDLTIANLKHQLPDDSPYK